MKKIGVLMLTLCVALTLFASCGSSAQQTPPANNDSAEADSAAVSDDSGTTTDYPTKAVTLVVPFDAGGASDMIARIIAQSMEKTLGQPIVIENRPGASGSVGMTYVTTSNPDGYTITYIPFSLLPQRKLGVSDLGPDSFEFIGQTNLVPTCLTVPINAPYNTAQEFIDYAKEHPGDVRIGNAGIGSASHIAAVALEQTTGVTFNHMPFKGGAEAATTVMGEHIEAVTINAGEVKAGVDAGKLKIIAVMSDLRAPSLPDVPTLKESGIDIGIDVSAWGSFGAPKGTPQDVLDVLSNALEIAAAGEEFAEFSLEQGMIVSYKDSEDFAKFVQEQSDYILSLLDQMDITG
jgi:tripartite-type tricarboxylate transporter receptor subunit TctC